MNNNNLLEDVEIFKQSLKEYGEINPELWLQIEPYLSIKKLKKNTSLVEYRWIAVSSVATQVKLVSLALIYSTLLFIWISTLLQKIKMDINPS